MRRRALRALAATALAAVALTGCSGPVPGMPKVTPWAVANHEEKVAYHANAGEALLNLDATAGLATLEAFQATGYLHIDTETNAAAHFEYFTSVDGESHVSQRLSDDPGTAFDASHVAGSPYTYYLLGDHYKEELADGKSWVQLPAGDLGRMHEPEHNCVLLSVTFMCALIEAWNSTRDTVEALPVQLSEGEAGQQHFATAVTYDALAEAALIPQDGQFDGFVSESARSALIPLHLWVGADGVVTKIEVNGVLSGDSGQTLKLQIGFEITSREASSELVPVDDSAVPASDVLRISTQSQLDEFIRRLEAL